MQYRLQDLIDMELFQDFQDRLNEIYSFSSAIVDNDGNILTATAWQDICIKFHRIHPECEKECIKSDQYILSHLHEANPAVSYRCPHGLVDNATPIIIDGVHYGNFFTGQFFLEQPDMEFFRAQAEKYGFDEEAYLEAVSKVPVWTQKQLDSYLFFIKGLIAIISENGLKHLTGIETQKQVEESTERAETILNQMQDGFWIINVDDGQVIEVNDAMCRLLGYSRDELLTMTLADVEANHSPEEIAQKLQLIKKNGSSNFESRFRRKDGSVFHVEISITYLEKRNLFFGFHHDITSRKQEEEALQTSESKYHELADLLPQIVYEIDLQGNLTFLNKKAYEIFGYTEEDIPELQNAFNLIAPADRPRAKENAARLLNGLPPINSEYRALRKDGSTIPINIYSSTIFRNGVPAGIRGLIVDITEQKKTEEALRESEKRLGDVIFSVADWVWEINKDGVYTYSSQKGFDILGRSHDEIIGRTPFDFMPPDEAKRIAEIFSEIAAQKKPITNFENIYLGKNGEEICLLTNAVPILDEEGNLIAYRGADQDITERRKMASALEESEKRYRVFLDSTDDMAFLKDDQFRYIMVNRANAEYFGKDETEIRGKTDFDLMPEENALKCRASDKKVFDSDGVIIEEERVGERIYETHKFKVALNNTVYGIGGYVKDITERKHAEDALRESEEIFNRFMEHSPIYVFFKDADIRSIRLSKNYEAMLGKPMDELLGKTMDDLFPSDLAKSMIADDRRILDQGNVFTVEEEFNGKYYSTIKFPIFIEGKPRFLAGYTIDITDRKHAEIEREKLEAQLLQAQKMEAVGRLAGGVAHDFNNMLSIILGNAELAMTTLDPDSSLHGNLEEIKKAAERSTALTRQLLAFARKQTVAPKVLDLNFTVEGMLKMLQRLIGENIDLVWHPGEIWAVKIDPSQIDQILANLCVNARDAIDDVGKVTIETSNVVVDNTYSDEDDNFVAGEYVMLAVSDNGCGMDKQTQSKLFEPFFTTKEMGKGTGLGLATVYGIVKQNNGFINVYSESGQGTIFKIYLPRHLDKSLKQKSTGVLPAKVKGNETILVVEDEQAILSMTRMMLEHLGYRIIAASTPGEAIHLAREHAGEIHLLITDVVMPEMNGRDLARNLLSLYPRLKRLFMSGYTANVIAHHGVLDEGVNFIQKPFTMKDLVEKVRDVFDN